MQTSLSYYVLEPFKALKLWCPAVVFHHWCISVAVACHQMPLLFANLLWFHLVLYSLFVSLLMHSDILVFAPQQHTIHVVVSCIFHNLDSLIFTVSLSSLHLCSCLICYWVTSQITWMSPWLNETEIHTMGAFLLVTGREEIEDFVEVLCNQINIVFILIKFWTLSLSELILSHYPGQKGSCYCLLPLDKWNCVWLIYCLFKWYYFPFLFFNVVISSPFWVKTLCEK